MKYAALISLCLFITCLSCNQTEKCKSNCYPLKISGKVINANTNEPVPNLRMELYWEENSSKSMTFTKTVKKFSTDKDGTFNLVQDIDTTMWPHWEILWLSAEPGKYGGGAKTMKAFDPNGFSDLVLTVYPEGGQ